MSGTIQNPAADPNTPPTDAGFVAFFPEFNDASDYTGVQRQYWLNLAIASLNARRWGQFYSLGCYLYAAHHLTVFSGHGNRRLRQRPGKPPLLQASKSAGGLSVSYDVQSVAIKDGGLWNSTSYGIRWLELANMVGLGVEQIGYGPIPPLYPGEGVPASAVKPNSIPATNLLARGSTQSDALPIVAGVSIFTSVPTGTGARLPNAAGEFVIENQSTERNDELVYPPVNGSFSGMTANLPVAVGWGQRLTFSSNDGLEWFVA